MATTHPRYGLLTCEAWLQTGVSVCFREQATGGKLVGLLEGTISLCVTWGCGGKLPRCSYLSSISECHPINHSVTLGSALVTPCLVQLGTFFPSCGDGQQSCLSSIKEHHQILVGVPGRVTPRRPMLIMVADTTPSGKCSIFESAPETWRCLSSATGPLRCFSTTCSFFASDLRRGMCASGDTPALQPLRVLWEDLRHALMSSRM